MTVMTADERGDLAEALLPDAAALAVAVREEPVEQIAARLRGLERHELEALAVVLAALVDPDRSMTDALSWVNFDEYGDPVKPSKSVRSVRQMVRDDLTPYRTKGVDSAIVERALRGGPLPRVLTSRERTAAVDLGLRRGMSYDDVARVLGMEREAVQRSWERSKAQARADGRWVPPGPVGELIA